MEEKITTIYLVRHASIELKDGEAVEQNPPLNKKGLKQAYELAKQFQKSNLDINILITSSMKRATETAGIIGKLIRKKPLIFSEFNEFSRSIFERRFWKKKFWINYLRYRRSYKKFDELLKKNMGKTIIFVIHGNVIRGLMGRKLGLSFGQIKHFSYNNAHISRLTFKDKKLNTISYFNSETLF
ncbi:MAG: histidine phosphatase family protein [Nanoarchaeota archaeon]